MLARLLLTAGLGAGLVSASVAPMATSPQLDEPKVELAVSPELVLGEDLPADARYCEDSVAVDDVLAVEIDEFGRVIAAEIPSEEPADAPLFAET